MSEIEKKQLARHIRDQAARLGALIDEARLAGLNVWVSDPFIDNWETRKKFQFGISIREPQAKPVEY